MLFSVKIDFQKCTWMDKLFLKKEIWKLKSNIYQWLTLYWANIFLIARFYLPKIWSKFSSCPEIRKLGPQDTILQRVEKRQIIKTKEKIGKVHYGQKLFQTTEYRIEGRYNWRGPPYNMVIQTVLHLFKKYLSDVQLPRKE